MTWWPGAGGSSVSAGWATPARSTLMPPACSWSAWAGPPGSMRFLTALPKTYEAEVVLGTATSTLDASGEVTGTWDMDGITLAEVRAAAVSLTGPIEQVPPMVSAVKVGGQRLHTWPGPAWRSNGRPDRSPSTASTSIRA